VRANARGIERDIRRLDREERVLMSELQKLAKDQKLPEATAKARELVRLKVNRTRLGGMQSQLKGISGQLAGVEGSAKMHSTIQSTAKALGGLNARYDINGLQKSLIKFEQETVRMGDKQELVDGYLENAFEVDNETMEVEDAVINVLKQVGLESQLELKKPSTTTLPSDELALRLMKLHT
jgi:hypothetical protein